ncbi:hypothetical protein MJO28_017136 [Puccinia striiformis f. sp. tritici]|uniref:Uncharacterized protein n=2 Tax=Puccinia striiformis TaxID=27350 RepID=A0A0L0VU57_9BASI|nr:hypothetical protein MJO28_017136 [Puccinia striiformis f. sp. tritici]KAI9607744.1 hypothetical protein H4Q26_005189 [Puccinia striiformis f. sp. tritici PST-130]KNF02819.1 hypothetical protein PSTG_04104 [Puccinia striiformis f. sp. tritici PST-78]POV99822.1 hypothetical protein PSTT_13515 [Puccinia striiformis]
MSDKNIQVNRSLACQGHFEMLAPTVADIRENQQYGPISIRSFYTSHAADPIDYEISLSTNTSIDNVLEEGFIYSIAGKLIAPNSACQPTLYYLQGLVTKVSAVEGMLGNYVNKTMVQGVGLVVSHGPEKVDEDAPPTGAMSIGVAHRDWDANSRSIKVFNVNYILPASPRLINKHPMIRPNHKNPSLWVSLGSRYQGSYGEGRDHTLDSAEEWTTTPGSTI